MDSAGLVQNFETGLYENELGRRYVRCAFDEDDPTFIDVSGDRWSASYRGEEEWIDW